MATTSYGTPYVQSSDLVSGWPTASLNVANRIDAVSYSGNGLNAQTGTTYTLVVGDAGKTVTLNNAAAVTVTLPQDSTANLPTGAVVHFYNLGAGTVTISAGAGATFQAGPLTVTQYGYAAVIKLSANTYGPFDAVPTPPGFVLLTPTSIANSGGSSSLSGSKVTATGVTSISINGIFSSTYDVYMLSMSFNHSTAASYLTARLRLSGTDATGTNYQYAVGLLYNAFTALTSEYNGTAMRISRSGDDTTKQGETIMYLRNPGAASPTSGHADSNYPYTETFGTRLFGGFWHSLSTAYDGITLYSSAGTLTGDIRVYGIRN